MTRGEGLPQQTFHRDMARGVYAVQDALATASTLPAQFKDGFQALG